MRKLLSTLSKFSVRQKLMLIVIGLALLPTIGMIVWGVGKAVQSAEFVNSDWTNPNRPTPSPVTTN